VRAWWGRGAAVQAGVVRAAWGQFHPHACGWFYPQAVDMLPAK
jgi:hypothetical protein